MVGGEILDIFDRDELEVILSQLAEDMVVNTTEPDTMSWSADDIKQLFIKARILEGQKNRFFHGLFLLF